MSDTIGKAKATARDLARLLQAGFAKPNTGAARTIQTAYELLESQRLVIETQQGTIERLKRKLAAALGDHEERITALEKKAAS